MHIPNLFCHLQRLTGEQLEQKPTEGELQGDVKAADAIDFGDEDELAEDVVHEFLPPVLLGYVYTYTLK